MAKATKKQKDQPGDNGAAEQVRRRAYELYEQRGRLDGFDVEDWLQAEREVAAEQRRN